MGMVSLVSSSQTLEMDHWRATALWWGCCAGREAQHSWLHSCSSQCRAPLLPPGAPGVSSQLVVPDAGADGVGVAGVVGDGSVV